MKNGFSSSEKFLAIVLTILAVVSPLYIDRSTVEECENDEEAIMSLTTLSPLLLFVLMLSIALSLYLDKSLTKFDPYWIHRVGGSSGGIIVVLVVLAFVLKCKADV